MGDPWADFEAKVQAMGAGPGASAGASGPTAASALGNNYLTGGKAPVVYWGSNPAMPANTGDGDPRRAAVAQERDMNGTSDQTMSLQDAMSDWYKWTDAERSAFGQRLYKLGMVNNPNDYGQLFNAWQGAVQEASNYYMAAGRKVTPWQAIDLMANTAGGGLKPTTQTQTSKSLNIPTIEDAHALTKQLFSSLMGRGPNQEELDRYASMMTGYAQKHPSITKTTQTTDAHGNTTSSSTSSGGYTQAGLQDMLSAQEKADPEYGAYQAATTYWNALMGALGGNGNG